MKKRLCRFAGFAVLLALFWSVALLCSCQFAPASRDTSVTEAETETETVVEPSRPSGIYRHEESETHNGEIVSKVVSDISFEDDTVVFNESEKQDDVMTVYKVVYFAEIGDDAIQLYSKAEKSEDSRTSTLYYTLEDDTLTLYYNMAGYNNKVGGVEYVTMSADVTETDVEIVPTVDEPGQICGAYSREFSETINGATATYVQRFTFAGDTLILEEEILQDDALTTRKTGYYAEIDDNTVKLFTKQDKSEDARVMTMYYTLEDDTLTVYYTEALYNARTGGIEYEYKE